jgi:hypothetical protein
LNKLLKGQGNNTVADSSITDDGVTVSMTTDLDVTGDISASVIEASTNFAGDLIGTASFAVSASYAPFTTPDLQAVTDAGNSTTNDITVNASLPSNGVFVTGTQMGTARNVDVTLAGIEVAAANVFGPITPYVRVVNDATTATGQLIIPSTGNPTLDGGTVNSLDIKQANIRLFGPSGDTATTVTGSLNVTAGITGSLQGTASYALTASFAENADPFPYTGNVGITGDINLTGSYNRLSGSFSGSVIDNITDVYTTSPSIEHVISLTQAEYNAVSASADPNTLYYITDAVSSVVSASYALSSSYALTASLAATATTASYFDLTNVNQDVVITGSVRGNVSALSISSNTASMDLSNGNFYTLQLVSGSDTLINPSNILPGQTINLRINTTGSATVSFPSTVKQVSGSAYVPTTTTSTDIVTFISFDTGSLFLSNVKNLV